MAAVAIRWFSLRTPLVPARCRQEKRCGAGELDRESDRKVRFPASPESSPICRKSLDLSMSTCAVDQRNSLKGLGIGRSGACQALRYTCAVLCLSMVTRHETADDFNWIVLQFSGFGQLSDLSATMRRPTGGALRQVRQYLQSPSRFPPPPLSVRRKRSPPKPGRRSKLLRMLHSEL